MAVAGMCPAQEIIVTSAAGAVEILEAGTAETMNDVEGARIPLRNISRLARRRSREIRDPQRLPEPGHGKSLVGDIGGRRDLSRKDRHILSRSGEGMGDLPRHVLDSAGARDKAFDHKCNAQWGRPQAKA